MARFLIQEPHDAQKDLRPMEIRLLPELEELIRRKVEAGEYDTASDLVTHAVYLLDTRDRMRAVQLEELRREVQIGLDECKRGEVEPFTKETARRIKERGRQRLAVEAERLRAAADRLAEEARQQVDEPAKTD
jgi:putative addiction module CopG family antidote